jgi:transcriptional regulator with XRE-family HTH domain
MPRTAICPICGKSFTLSYIGPDHPGIYCSHRCVGVSQRKYLTPPTPLGRFLFNRWRESGLTMQDFSKTIGISPSTFSDYMKRARLPTNELLSRLRLIYGEALPGIPLDADRRRERGRQLYQQYGHLAHTREAVQKGAKTRTGRKQSPEHTAKIVAAHTDSGHFARSAKRFNLTNRWVRQARMTLFNRLRGANHPTETQLQQWTEQVAQRLQVPRAAVLAIWRPHLLKRRLIDTGGRPAEIDYLQVHQWRMENPPVKWLQIGVRLDRDPGTLMAGYYRWRKS